MLGKIEGMRTRAQEKMRSLDGITNSMDMSLSKFQGIVKDREAWRVVVLVYRIYRVFCQTLVQFSRSVVSDSLRPHGL